MKLRIGLIEASNNIARDFKNTLLKVVDTRFGHYFEFNTSNKELLLAAVTLPRYKSAFIQDKNDEDFVKNLLLLECKKMCVAESSEDTNVVNEEQQNIEQPEDISKQDHFIITFERNENSRRKSLENQIEAEVSNFFLDSRTESDMLNDYHHIRNVYYRYNTTLSSSAAIERVFSQTQMVYTPRRNRISAANFEKTIMLKHNRLLIDSFEKK